MAPKQLNRYSGIIEEIFKNKFKPKSKVFEFSREDIETVATKLNIVLPKNIGDLIYSFRYRTEFPASIKAQTPDDKEWIIKGTAKGKYCFQLVDISRIIPRTDAIAVKIPDATPEIIRHNALGDEQALLAKVRYNRLIDIFLGISSFSLQNHLRTTVANVGQIEIDEVYVGVDKRGRQFIIPVQAKGGHDKHGVVQTQQDVACCEEKFPLLICRPVSAQFMDDEKIAMFELKVEDNKVFVVEERHYQLVQANEISDEDLRSYDR
jgi:hypothetical protein